MDHATRTVLLVKTHLFIVTLPIYLVLLVLPAVVEELYQLRMCLEYELVQKVNNILVGTSMLQYAFYIGTVPGGGGVSFTRY